MSVSVLQSLGKIDALITIVDKELTKSNIDKNDGLNMSQNKNIICKPFGTTENGEQVDLYILTNKTGMEVEIINYGGHIRALRVPSSNSENKSQDLIDVTIGLDNIFDYEHKIDILVQLLVDMQIEFVKENLHWMAKFTNQ